jgi:transcriptional/translational regulatory protein YebC/TACO1
MNFVFSNHALIRMKRRSISNDIVIEVIIHADSISVQDESITVYSKLVEENTKPYLYRVFVNNEKTPPLIITAYKTSKIKKYGN